MSKVLPKEVESLKNLKDIQIIKRYLLGSNKRNYLMFVLGINIGLRIGDLLRLKISDVLDPESGNIATAVQIKEQKTKKYREFELNKAARDSIDMYLSSLDGYFKEDYLFKSRKGTGPLTPRAAHKIIKNTLRELKIKGNYGTHTLRKTFGYHRYINNVNMETLQKLFNHSSPAVTLRYIGITKQDIIDAYNSVNL